MLDGDGDFSVRCNKGMVDVEPLEEQDIHRLQELLRRHYQLTQSAVAERVLSNWKAAVQQFVKVMPTEYRQILAKAHLDSDAAKLASI